jgi:hypothetical protein
MPTSKYAADNTMKRAQRIYEYLGVMNARELYRLTFEVNEKTRNRYLVNIYGYTGARYAKVVLNVYRRQQAVRQGGQFKTPANLALARG